jgi:alanyl aminopeptidase
MKRGASLAILLAAVALLLACSAAPPAPPPRPEGTPSTLVATPPALRLPTTVLPVKQSATLSLSPEADTFDGSTDIELDVRQATPLLWLNATEIAVREAWAEVGGARLATRVVAGGDDFVGFAFERPLPVGRARLHVAYGGKVTAKDDRGVFRMNEGAATFLFTQFQTTEARRAFPCFDEPSFKHPWQLTLRAPASQVVLSNTPAVEDKPDGAGWKSVRFAETRPLPAYLVAFTVGPYELVDAGRAGKKGTPLRIAVPPGKAAHADFARAALPKIVGLLEDYFGIPYPYDKLDLVSVPNLVSFGAMENAGLITFTSGALLAEPGEDTPAYRDRVVLYVSHEVAHHWFGNLVTTAWWDDIWLNEGFATWMEVKITQRFDPAFGEDQAEAAALSAVMSEDGLLSARKVRQPVLTRDDIANAFDGITYQKGSAVLGMFEAWLGPDAFQKGVRHYLEKFADDNATSADFFTALGEGAGQDISPAMSTFLDQPGVPLVTPQLVCDAGVARLALKQERNLPIGSQGAAAALWHIPVCARYGAGAASGRACVMLREATGDLPLPRLPSAKSGCPDWVMLKEGGHGYYRVALSARDLHTLLAPGKVPLTPRERVVVVSDGNALVSNGKLQLGDALATVPALIEDRSPFVQTAAVNLMGWLQPTFVEPALHPKVARFVDRTLAPRVKELGWRPRREDSSEVGRLRLEVLGMLSTLGADPKLVAPASQLAERWLDDPRALEPEVVETVLRIAAARGDRRLFDRLVSMVKAERDTKRRNRLLAGLAGFRDPALVRASLSLYLADDMDAREGITLLFGQDLHNRQVTWDFVKEHYDALIAKLPDEMQPGLFSVADFCDEAHLAEVRSFFGARAGKVTGAPRQLAQAVEKSSLCIAQKAAHRASLEKFLARQ